MILQWWPHALPLVYVECRMTKQTCIHSAYCSGVLEIRGAAVHNTVTWLGFRRCFSCCLYLRGIIWPHIRTKPASGYAKDFKHCIWCYLAHVPWHWKLLEVRAWRCDQLARFERVEVSEESMILPGDRMELPCHWYMWSVESPSKYTYSYIRIQLQWTECIIRALADHRSYCFVNSRSFGFRLSTC